MLYSIRSSDVKKSSFTSEDLYYYLVDFFGQEKIAESRGTLPPFTKSHFDIRKVSPTMAKKGVFALNKVLRMYQKWLKLDRNRLKLDKKSQ